jgi:hypothetical protein
MFNLFEEEEEPLTLFVKVPILDGEISEPSVGEQH